MAKLLNPFLIMIIIAFLCWLYGKGINEEKSKGIIHNLNNETKTQNEIIQDQAKLYKRKIINKSVSANNNLEWLHQNICQDCKN